MPILWNRQECLFYQSPMKSGSDGSADTLVCAVCESPIMYLCPQPYLQRFNLIFHYESTEARYFVPR
jgi:hypothetical protein